MSRDRDELLGLLEAHGKNFLKSFDRPNSRKHPGGPNAESNPKGPGCETMLEGDDDGVEEWYGFGGRGDGHDVAIDSSVDGSDSGDGEEDFVHDDGYTADSSNQGAAVVVFSEIRGSSTTSMPSHVSKQQLRAFMSSKITKVRADVGEDVTKTDGSDQEDERSNAQNDALLHQLVHTKLLSGSLNPDLDLTSAQRKKALAGRVLELAGTTKLGKGEKVVRDKERARASKRVREGLLSKQAERRERQIAEAKDMGNYHPTLKRLFQATEENDIGRKRQKGLGMGVGRFKGGVLRLSRQEIDSVNGQTSRGGPPSNRGRGRGRRGGRAR